MFSTAFYKWSAIGKWFVLSIPSKEGPKLAWEEPIQESEEQTGFTYNHIDQSELDLSVSG